MSLGIAGVDDGLSAANATQGGGGFKAQLPRAGYNQIGNLVGFKVAPHIFYRVEFRRIGGKTFDLDSATGRKNKLTNQHAAVNGRPIPHHQYFAGNVPLQVPQKFYDLQALDAPPPFSTA